MISALKKLLNQRLGDTGPRLTQSEAAAALLIEVVLADEDLSGSEQQLLPELIARLTGVSTDEAHNLITNALDRHQQAISFFEYTDLINKQFDLAEKQSLILAMWQLGFSDGELCQYEEQIIRKTADLLYLKHSELIQLRNQAKAG
ncbi:TerB family tellurite resistance protein [Shewanella litorisediminis]|uniref:TerB family tellurite resistance protein n=2 Tax=Shewanella litorisediminis TaxID=1173586 RepID=A0ABX7G8K3_9GAMM|nr:TerB family tellurite resistance protein [Shewanella litorisediminis]MCL2917191.1 TerB family tellurite resistance protein [Shewanella litorisediminis]QRH03722.1 TerB family tellurite resistance protein [Shewanella litorisediminis]